METIKKILLSPPAVFMRLCLLYELSRQVFMNHLCVFRQKRGVTLSHLLFSAMFQRFKSKYKTRQRHKSFLSLNTLIKHPFFMESWTQLAVISASHLSTSDSLNNTSGYSITELERVNYSMSLIIEGFFQHPHHI